MTLANLNANLLSNLAVKRLAPVAVYMQGLRE
jgi:hypothetical protein